MKSIYWTNLAAALMVSSMGLAYGQEEAIPATNPSASTPAASSPAANSSSSSSTSGKTDAVKSDAIKTGEPKLRITVSAVGASEVFTPIQSRETGGDGKTTMRRDTVHREVNFTMECDQISLQVTSNEKGDPSYSFTSTGPVVIYGQQMSLRGEDAIMENGKLIVKNAVVTSSIAKMQSSELILDIVANGISVNKWSATNSTSAAALGSGGGEPYFPNNSIPASRPQSTPPTSTIGR